MKVTIYLRIGDCVAPALAYHVEPFILFYFVCLSEPRSCAFGSSTQSQ